MRTVVGNACIENPQKWMYRKHQAVHNCYEQERDVVHISSTTAAHPVRGSHHSQEDGVWSPVLESDSVHVVAKNGENNVCVFSLLETVMGIHTARLFQFTCSTKDTQLSWCAVDHALSTEWSVVCRMPTQFSTAQGAVAENILRWS